MRHLCPYPRGPVRIDPHPLTFSDTQCIFHPLSLPLSLSFASARVGAQTRGCLYFSVSSGLLLADLSAGLRGAGQTHSESFRVFILLSLKPKGQTFPPACEM